MLRNNSQRQFRTSNSQPVRIISLIPAVALRVTALRHLLNGGLGVRADDANKSAWFASQCGIVVLYGGDPDSYSGARKAFEATRGEIRETHTSLVEQAVKLHEQECRSLISIKHHLGMKLTDDERDFLPLGMELTDDERDFLPYGRDNSAPPAPPTDPDPRSSSDFETFAQLQQEKMGKMDRRLDDLHAGLDVATDRLTWACQALYKTSTQMEELQRSHEHLVGYMERQLVGYLGEPGGLRNAGMESFPTTQRRTSPVYQPVYGFQGSPVYPMEDGQGQGSPTNPNGAEVVSLHITSPNLQ